MLLIGTSFASLNMWPSDKIATTWEEMNYSKEGRKVSVRERYLSFYLKFSDERNYEGEKAYVGWEKKKKSYVEHCAAGKTVGAWQCWLRPPSA